MKSRSEGGAVAMGYLCGNDDGLQTQWFKPINMFQDILLLSIGPSRGGEGAGRFFGPEPRTFEGSNFAYASTYY